MEAYLRSDLWAKPYIHRAEEYIAEGTGFQLKARATFSQAAIVGTAQVILQIVPAVFLSIGSFAAKVLSNLWKSSTLRSTIKTSSDWNHALCGSTIAVLIAVSSAIAPAASQKIQSWLQNQQEDRWLSVKTSQVQTLKDRIEEIKRESTQSPQELYLVGKKFFFDMRSRELVSKLEQQIHAAEQDIHREGTTEREREEKTQKSLNKIIASADKLLAEINHLPLTCMQLGRYRVFTAEKYLQKTERFLDREASIVRDRAAAARPSKFDTVRYDYKVDLYKQKMGKKLRSEIEKIEKQRLVVEAEWKQRVEPIEASIEDIEKQIESYRWRVKWFKWMLSEQTIEECKGASEELYLQKQQLQHSKSEAVKKISQSSLKQMDWLAAKQESTICSYMEEKKWYNMFGPTPIVPALEGFASSSLLRRVYRKLAAPSSEATGFKRAVEDLFDPDLDAFVDTGPRIVNWMKKYYMS